MNFLLDFISFFIQDELVKKFLPLILFLLGIGVFAGVYFLVIRPLGRGPADEDETVAEIPVEQRPIASLTPSEDGHWLVMKIGGIKIEAESLDYELLYKVSDGRTQGVPGTVKLEGKTSIERELLLGSESSGKFRYDEGVEEGTLTLRFRNERGKLVGKLSTDFHLQTGDNQLTSVDGKFSYQLDKLAKGVYFVTMGTFGFEAMPSGNIVAGPYGIFTSDKSAHPGTVDLEGEIISQWTASTWKELTSGKASDVGMFVSTSGE